MIVRELGATRPTGLAQPVAGGFFAGEPDGVAFFEDVVGLGVGGELGAVENADHHAVVVAKIATAQGLAGEI